MTIRHEQQHPDLYHALADVLAARSRALFRVAELIHQIDMERALAGKRHLTPEELALAYQHAVPGAPPLRYITVWRSRLCILLYTQNGRTWQGLPDDYNAVQHLAAALRDPEHPATWPAIKAELQAGRLRTRAQVVTYLAQLRGQPTPGTTPWSTLTNLVRAEHPDLTDTQARKALATALADPTITALIAEHVRESLTQDDAQGT